MSNQAETVTKLDRSARCACGETGTLREMRAHLRSIPNGDGHALSSYGDRALELSTLVRRASIAWATADRETARYTHVLELIELEICELADDRLDDAAHGRERSAGSVFLELQRDKAVIMLRAAIQIRSANEIAWQKAARDLLEEMCPADEDPGVGVQIQTEIAS
jgi:hypothetical protein